MKINKNSIVLSSLFVGLLFYFLFQATQIASLILGKNVLICNSCLQTIPTILLYSVTSLLGLSLVCFLFGLAKTVHFRKKLYLISAHSRSLKMIEKEHLLDRKIIVFSHKDPLAFCLGILKPKIYLSTKLLKIMNSSELEAVILHEKQHLQGNDNLFLVLPTLLKTTFFFLPIFSDIAQRFEVQKEIRADQNAIKEIGDKSVLISALQKILFTSQPNLAFANYFSKFTSLEVRINSLLGERTNRRLISLNNLVISFGMLLLIATVILNRVEIHSQLANSALLCLDKGNCQGACY